MWGVEGLERCPEAQSQTSGPGIICLVPNPFPGTAPSPGCWPRQVAWMRAVPLVAKVTTRCPEGRWHSCWKQLISVLAHQISNLVYWIAHPENLAAGGRWHCDGLERTVEHTGYSQVRTACTETNRRAGSARGRRFRKNAEPDHSTL